MDIFNYDYYRNVLKQMKMINDIYSFKLIDNNVKNGYILRHDVDFDLKKAYTMCTIEKEMNVTSTYFILVTSEFYSVLSSQNRNMIKKMSSSGFEIGLHFDPSSYGNITLSQMKDKVKMECSIIEDIIGERVETVSLHTPSIYNQYPIFDGYKNAYSKKFFDEENYLSDSCKCFRGKDVLTFIEGGKKKLLQILFHPIHFAEQSESYTKVFNKIIEDKINNFDKYMDINKTYKSEIGTDSLVNCFVNYIKGKNFYE